MKLDAIQILDDMNKEFKGICSCDVLLGIESSNPERIRIRLIAYTPKQQHSAQFFVMKEFLNDSDQEMVAKQLNLLYIEKFWQLRRLINYGF